MRLTPRILGTACIPWTDSYQFAEDIFRQSVRDLRRRGLQNLYIFGTAGEGHAVTDRQFCDIARVFLDEMRDPAAGICQLGVIGLSTPQIKARIEMGLEIGFRSFQISFPSWGALNDIEVDKFFDDILGAYPQCDFLHYNLLRGHRKLTGSEYANIIRRHANLVSTKSSANPPMQILRLLRFAPELCHFMTEQDFAMAGMFGQVGLLISIGVLHPQRTLRFFNSVLARDTEAARRFLMEFVEIQCLLHEGVGAERAHMDGAFDKIYAKALIPEFPLRLLPPYHSISDMACAGILAKLRHSQPAWFRAQDEA